MDILPHRVIRYIMLGERERVLSSKTIWSCLQCYTCSVRCPNDIHIGHVFDTARKIAVREKKALSDVWTFDTLFLESVKKHGRLYELGAVMRYKLKKKDFFSDREDGPRHDEKGQDGHFPAQHKGQVGLEKGARAAKPEG